MDFFSLLTDPKVWLIIAIIALLVVLGIYTWRQSNHIEELKNQHTKITEQVKHGLKLSEPANGVKALVHLRPDIASNMSDDTCDPAQRDEQEWDESHAPQNNDDDESDDEHNAYIQQLIRMKDNKRAVVDEYIIPAQQQSGHTADPVYDSHDEEIIFRDYNDDESDGASESELIKHVQEEMSHVVNPTDDSMTETKIQHDMERMDAEIANVVEEPDLKEKQEKPKIAPIIKPKVPVGVPGKLKINIIPKHPRVSVTTN
jgi:hypothetical protein